MNWQRSAPRPARISHLREGDTVYYKRQQATIRRIFYSRRRQGCYLLIEIQTGMGSRCKEVSSNAGELHIPRSASMI